MEVSAKTGSNVMEAFHALATYAQSVFNFEFVVFTIKVVCLRLRAIKVKMHDEADDQFDLSDYVKKTVPDKRQERSCCI